MQSFPWLTGCVFIGRVSISRPSSTWKRTPQPVPQYEHVEGMILKSIRIAPYRVEDFGLNIDGFKS
jgi:hypothetical protein